MRRGGKRKVTKEPVSRRRVFKTKGKQAGLGDITGIRDREVHTVRIAPTSQLINLSGRVLCNLITIPHVTLTAGTLPRNFSLSRFLKSMNTSEFLGELEEALEVPAGTFRLDDLLAASGYWDSMAALTFMALADQRLDASVSGSQLKECKTVRDLVGLLGDKIAA